MADPKCGRLLLDVFDNRRRLKGEIWARWFTSVTRA